MKQKGDFGLLSHFSEPINKRLKTNTKFIMKLIKLNEGIVHIEDLPLDKFMDSIRNIFNFYVSEKIDGANLWFGLDESSRFYTTREQKSGDKERKFKSADYSKVAAYNGFRSAHDALEVLVKKHKNLLEPGDNVEIEVVFGKQPNVVKYSEDGTNFIVLLRPVNDTDQSRYDAIVKALDGKEVVVQSTIIDTIDGKSLVDVNESCKWKVVKNVSEKISSSLISQKDVNKLLSQMESYIKSRNDVVSDLLGKEMSNFDVLTMRMVGIPASVKDDVKEEKQKQNQYVLTTFKLPIKRKIFDDLISKGEFLSAKFKNKEQSDVEGFVISNGDDQIKIVDRDLFTAINEFNFKIRNELNSAVMSDDMDAPLINRGGIFGNCKLRIANLFDVKELAKSARAKKIFASYKGSTPEETINNFVKSLKINDFEMFKTKIVAILNSTEDDLDARLEVFKKESGDYKVQLKNGKTIPYSDESKKRTLLAFAELTKELEKLKAGVRKAKSTNDLIATIYGRFVNDVHKQSSSKEKSMNEELSLIRSVISLKEDDGGTGAPSGDASGSLGGTPVSPSSTGTTSGDIAPLPVRMFNGKVIKRIKRNYFPKKKKSINKQ